MIIVSTSKKCDNCGNKECVHNGEDYRLHSGEDACWKPEKV